MKRATASLLLLLALAPTLLTAARVGDAPPLPFPPSPRAPAPAAAPAAPHPTLPAEFEPQAALVLAASEVEGETLDVILRIATTAATRAVVLVLVRDEHEESRLVDRLDEAAPERAMFHPIYVVQVPHDTHWTRDYGPVALLDAQRRPVMLDFEYAGFRDAHDDDRARDELVPFFLAGILDTPCVHVPVLLDGGNLVTNGAGLAVTTRALFEENAVAGRSYDEVVRRLKGALGLQELVVLEPLEQEPTRHADIFMTFTGRREVVVARIDPRRDPINAARLDENARILAGVQTPFGPLRVTRIPMPRESDGLWRSYTNVIYMNGVVLIPSYPDIARSTEEFVHATYRRLLPGWKVIPVDCRALLTGGGALRCVSTPIPWLPGGPFTGVVRPWR